MDPADLLRFARRYAGLSQRALAEAARVSPTAVAKVEMGGRVTVNQLEELVAHCGMRLTLGVERETLTAEPETPGDVRRHLSRPPGARILAVLMQEADAGRPIGLAPPLAVFDALVALASTDADVAVSGAVALAMWSPYVGDVGSNATIALHVVPGRTTERVLRTLASLPGASPGAANPAGTDLPLRITTRSGVFELRHTGWRDLQAALPVAFIGRVPHHRMLRFATPAQLTWSGLALIRAAVIQRELEAAGERVYGGGRRTAAHRDTDVLRRWRDELWWREMLRRRQQEQRSGGTSS